MARVEAVNVSEGDIVEQDAVLVQLDTTLPRQQAAQANAQAAANRVQAQQAADEIERLLPLVARGVVAEQQVDALEAQRAALDESVDAVEAMASLARAQRADGSIRAPFAGTVTAVPLEVGAIASPGAPLVRLLDMSEVDVRVSLSEAEMSAVAVGDIVRIRVPGAGIEREGHIRFVDPELDPATRLGEVLVRVENSDRRLLAGSFAAVTAPRANTAEVLIVPPDAILRTAAGASVFVVTPSGFERRTVVVERLSDGQWAVASGLVAGERVATGALSGLAATSTVVAVEGGAP